MARYILNGSGQYVDPNSGSVLIDSYKADGSGGFVNNSGQYLNAAQPTAIRGQQQPSLRERAFTAAQENQRKYEEAVQSQMDQVLAGYKERRDAASKSLAKLGDVNIADINAKYDAMLGTARSRANATGMGATTAMAGTEALIERERQAALARARGSRTGMEIDTMSQLEGDRIRAIENMNIAPPDNSTLLELARMEGEATQQGLDAGAWGAAGGGGAVGLAPAMIGGSGYGGFASGGFNIPTAAMGLGGGFMGGGGGSGRRGGPSLGVLRNLKAGKLDPVYNDQNQLAGYQRVTPPKPATSAAQQDAIRQSARRLALAKQGQTVTGRSNNDLDIITGGIKYQEQRAKTYTPTQVSPNQQLPARPGPVPTAGWMYSAGMAEDNLNDAAAAFGGTAAFRVASRPYPQPIVFGSHTPVNPFANAPATVADPYMSFAPTQPTQGTVVGSPVRPYGGTYDPTTPYGTNVTDPRYIAAVNAERRRLGLGEVDAPAAFSQEAYSPWSLMPPAAPPTPQEIAAEKQRKRRVTLNNYAPRFS